MARSVSLHTMEEIEKELAATGLTMENIEDRLAEIDEAPESLDE